MKPNKCTPFALLLLCLLQWPPVCADDQPWPGTSLDQPSPGLSDYLPELVLRPFGAVGNLLGLGMFVAASPITLLASIEPPHDAVAHSFNGFVLAPYRYTFRRPLGVYRFPVTAADARAPK
jgi:hypothetical protein